METFVLIPILYLSNSVFFVNYSFHHTLTNHQVSVLGELNDLLQATQDLNESILRGGSKKNRDMTDVALDPISALHTVNINGHFIEHKT